MEEEERKLIYKDKEERKVSGNLVSSVDANNLYNQNDKNSQTKNIPILLKCIRSMSYKGLQSIFQLFDNDDEKEIFNKELTNDLRL